MQPKKMIWIFAALCGWLGGYVPLLWGAGGFTMSTVIGNSLGALFGVWIGFKLSR